MPSAVHAQIENAYQHCDRLNHRIEGYIEEYKDTHFPVILIPASVFQLRDDDEEALREGRKKIDAANTAISERIDSRPKLPAP